MGNTGLDRVVAIKVLNQPVADDPAYLEALQREAQLAAGLDHPNITTVHDFQVENGTAFIVMKYVPDSLDKHLSHGRRVLWRRAVEIVAQVARALEPRPRERRCPPGHKAAEHLTSREWGCCCY